MDNAVVKLACQWLDKAKSDLATANILINGTEKHLDTGVYHCQQAVEKSLKAFLTLHGSIIAKTHDIEMLVSLCSKYDRSFSQFLEMATEITPYATEFRYPGELMEPSAMDAESAYHIASELLAFVGAKISGSC
jgi:HEPN domain-containing protein